MPLLQENYPNNEIANSHPCGPPKKHVSPSPRVDNEHGGHVHGNENDILNRARNEVCVTAETGHVKHINAGV
jgi:hypothetical protein